MTKVAIIIPCFNRADSLKRLIRSINSAIYCDPYPVLIFSIDGGGSQDVIDVAESFNFEHGEKKVIVHQRNIGLKQNIIFCGGQTKEYDFVIILEDDIFVAPLFYLYSLQSIRFYENSDNVAGISLYSQKFNETSGLPFLPNKDQSDTFFIQLPSSWGQIWTKHQWSEFYIWYINNPDLTEKQLDKLPQNIQVWSNQSWKKYFCVFMVEHDKFFVYPYYSLSTNFCSPGGFHIKYQNNYLQTQLLMSVDSEYQFKFSDFIDSIAVYDMFCENISTRFINIIKKFNSDISVNNICIDLNGLKDEKIINKFRFVLTTKKTDVSLFLFGLNLKSIENNVILDNAVESEYGGAFIFLTESKYLIDKKYNPPYELIEYFCGVPLTNRHVFIKVFFRLLKRIKSKVLNLF